MGHSEMLLAVAGLKQDELRQRTEKLATGDWSDMSSEDRSANRRAIRDGTRIFTSAQVGEYRFFIITEADRSATTILLAEEY